MSSENLREATQQAAEPAPIDWVEIVRQHAGSLKFGTVLITVHDSRVIQVEKGEKVRFDGIKQPSKSPTPNRTYLSR